MCTQIYDESKFIADFELFLNKSIQNILNIISKRGTFIF